jgi:hypothetical protein
MLPVGKVIFRTEEEEKEKLSLQRFLSSAAKDVHM